MSNTILVGAQWGDEGKGKITDLLARGVQRLAQGGHAVHETAGRAGARAHRAGGDGRLREGRGGLVEVAVVEAGGEDVRAHRVGPGYPRPLRLNLSWQEQTSHR